MCMAKTLVVLLVILDVLLLAMTINRVNSPVTSKIIRGVRFYIKRDDLRVTESGLNGNKGRKFDWLSRLARTSDFPTTLASFGGIQSNALGALARLVAHHNSGRTEVPTKLLYFVDGNPPEWLTANPVSNFRLGVSSGARIIPLGRERYEMLVKEQHGHGCELAIPPSIQSFLPSAEGEGGDTLFVPQGGATIRSTEGIFDLAKEVEQDIHDIVQREGREDEALSSRPWLFLIASGTGTVAYYCDVYLKNSFSRRVQVCTIPCVGSPEYLIEQMNHLKAIGAKVDTMPRILPSKDDRHKTFAKPRPEFLKIWTEVSTDDCEFDLVYTPRAFDIIFQHLEELAKDYNLLWYHCGGVEGNEAMKARYRRDGYY